jgi:hypothetical protein
VVRLEVLTMGDPREFYGFDDLHCGHVDFTKMLGNSDAIAGVRLTALWLFLLPIFKQLLNRKKQQKMTKAYFFRAFVYTRFYQPTTTTTAQRWLHWGRAKTSISTAVRAR